MRVAEIILTKLNAKIPKPKEDVCTIIEILFHSISKGYDTNKTLELLRDEFVFFDFPAEVLDRVTGNLPLVKLSVSTPATNLYLEILPSITVLKESDNHITCVSLSIENITRIMGYPNKVTTTFKSALYKAIRFIDSVSEVDLVFVKRDLKYNTYKIHILNNVGSKEELIEYLQELGIKSLQDIDTYVHRWRHNVERNRKA